MSDEIRKLESHNDPNRPTHPDFDGHLEKPLKDMTMKERLDWAWQGALLLHWARQARMREQEEA